MELDGLGVRGGVRRRDNHRQEIIILLPIRLCPWPWRPGLHQNLGGSGGPGNSPAGHTGPLLFLSLQLDV